MTTTAEHPDLQRLRDITRSRPRVASLDDALDGWVDPAVMDTVLKSYFHWLPGRFEEAGLDVAWLSDLDSTAVEVVGFTFTDAFLLGAMFQAAGGHREVDA